MAQRNMSRRQLLSTSLAAAAASAAPRALAAAAPFPEGFVWGTAASAYQLEGAMYEDGRGMDFWEPYLGRKGIIFADHDAKEACDHYHRYKEDVALMAALGLPSYRFSVAWPRVLPDGVGKVNTKGLDFYDRLVDELLAKKIRPYLMLYHWDLPQALHVRGGWLDRDVASWFAEYAAVVAKRLGDRVRDWMTIEEPQVFIGQGYLTGEYAPGYKVPFREYLLAAHNALLAHGKGAQAVRANAKAKKITLGLCYGCASFWPASDSPADVEATRRRTFWVDRDKHWNNAWWMDPVVFGRYPEEFAKKWEAELPRVPASDFATIKQPIDYMGINIYNSRPIRASSREPGWEALPSQLPNQAYVGDTHLLSPQGMYWSPKLIHERYQVPLFITENGCPGREFVGLDGKVHDPARIEYVTRYLRELSRTMAEGTKVLGYHLWSFLDNFEWLLGYKDRFGLVHVDYTTQKRTPKDSARWFKEVVATNGRSLFAATN